MPLAVNQAGPVCVLAVGGRIDHPSAAAFEVALAPHLVGCAPGASRVLDFSGVEYISSVGLRVLLLASRKAAAQGGKIALAAPQPLVRGVLETGRFHFVMPVFDTVDAARAALS